MKHELLVLEKATIRSASFYVLHEFQFQLCEQDVLGIVCDSILEKDALLALFEGNASIKGTIRFHHQPVKPEEFYRLIPPQTAIINRKASLNSALSISDNICIFADHSSRIFTRNYDPIVRDLLHQFQLSLDLSAKPSSLSFFDRICVEILKAFYEKRKLILFYDCFDVLQLQEINKLRELIHFLHDRGYTFILFGSFHTLYQDLAEKILFIKNNTSLACLDVRFIAPDKIQSFLLTETAAPGKQLPQPPQSKADTASHREVNWIHCSTETLHDFHARLASGSVLNILCFDRLSLLAFKNLLNGSESLISGTILCGEKKLASPHTEFKNHYRSIMWLPRQPDQNYLISNMSTIDNLFLPLSYKVPHIWARRSYAEGIQLSLKKIIGAPIHNRKVKDLSPYERQVIAYCKVLFTSPPLAVIEQPFTGIDPHMDSITAKMIQRLLDRKINLILLHTKPSDLNRIPGDICHIKKGYTISQKGDHHET